MVKSLMINSHQLMFVDWRNSSDCAVVAQHTPGVADSFVSTADCVSHLYGYIWCQCKVTTMQEAMTFYLYGMSKNSAVGNGH